MVWDSAHVPTVVGTIKKSLHDTFDLRIRKLERRYTAIYTLDIKIQSVDPGRSYRSIRHSRSTSTTHSRVHSCIGTRAVCGTFTFAMFLPRRVQSLD